MTYGHPDGRNNWGSTYGMEGGLSITSPVHDSPMLGGFGFLARNYFSSESVVPRLGPVDDEEYLEYYFTLDPLSGDGESDRCTNYQPVRINIICDDEQYFTLWATAHTERVAVRNPSGNFKPGETQQQLVVRLRLLRTGTVSGKVMRCILLSLRKVLLTGYFRLIL